MTREMYESLKVTDLRGIAKQRGVTVNPRMKKAELIDLMMSLDAQAAGGLSSTSTGAPQADGKREIDDGAHEMAAAPAQDNSTAAADAQRKEDGHSEPAEDRQHTDNHLHEQAEKTEEVSAAREGNEDSSSSREEKNAAATPRARRGRPPKNAEAEREGTHPVRRGRKPVKQQKGQPSEQAAPLVPEKEEKQKPIRQNSPAGRTYITRANSNTAQNYSSGQPYIPPQGSQGPNPNMQNANVPGQNSTSRYQNSQPAAGQNAQNSQSTPSRYQNSQPAAGQNAQNSQNASPRYQNSQYTGQESASVQAPASVHTYTPSNVSASGVMQPQVNPNLAGRYERRGLLRPDQPIAHKDTLNKELDSGEMAHGILEVMPDGFGFIRSANYMPGEDDVYVAPSQIRRFNLKTGDILEGNIRVRTSGEKFSALLFVKSVNGLDPEVAKRRYDFEDMTPIFPNERIRLEQPTASVAMRVMDLFCPVGKGQRGMVVSPPKAGKTTLVKEVAKSVKKNNPEIHLIILLIDERPEEVTDIREALEGPNTEVIYSTFDELPEHHKRVSEMTIERAKRLVEQKRDVMILLDSITRLTRAYNLTEPSSGRTLTGGLDPVALHAPKRFFGAARNMREGGSLTILATALIETGSKMDDVVYEEFKGTGNMEVILNRKLSERRIFPAIDLAKSGTRRDDLLLTPDELDAVNIVRRAFIGARGEEATDSVLDLFAKTRTNGELVSMIRRHAWSY